MITAHDEPAHVRQTHRALWARVGFSLALIAILMLWILGAFRRDVIQAGRQPVPDESAAGLATCVVASQRVALDTEAVGTVQAERIAAVTSRVVANIVEMRASAGQHVIAGAPLVVLDDRDFRHRTEQARENVRSAQATLAQAQSDYTRDKPLFDRQVISPYEFEHTRTALETAEAGLHRLQQAEQEADVNQSYTVIRSAFDGVVVDTLAVEGDLATPGKPLLTMYEQKRLWLEASVPEGLAARVRVGQSLGFRLDAIDRPAEGRVVQLVPAADPSSRTVIVRVHVADTPGVLPGMFGRVHIPAEADWVLAVPASAVVRAGQLTMVDVVRDGRVDRRTVQLGRPLDGRFEVLSGLASGDVVVLRPADSAENSEAREGTR